ncbi:Uncharacterized protein OBRU01_05174, partial [Operophtera brumata]
KAIIKPWITQGLINCMRRRDKLHMKYKRNLDNEKIRQTYINYRNVCNKILKKLKRTYERLELEKHVKNSKDTWKTIKTICNYPIKPNPVQQLLTEQSRPKESLNKVNTYFKSVGFNLSRDILLSQNETEQTLAIKCNLRNRPILNATKTNFISFTINNSTQPKQEIELKMHSGTCLRAHDCDCSKLKSVAEIRYLG